MGENESNLLKLSFILYLFPPGRGIELVEGLEGCPEFHQLEIFIFWTENKERDSSDHRTLLD